MNDNSLDKISDIKGPLSAGSVWQWYLLVFVIFVLLVIATIFLLKFLKNRNRKESEEDGDKTKKTPYEIALERLDVLKEKDFLSRGLVKEYYFELSLIVRYYLEDRFLIRAPEMTFEEFLVSMKSARQLTDSQKELLRKFLQDSDMVKFAKYGPKSEEIKHAFDSAVELIENTKDDVIINEKSES